MFVNMSKETLSVAKDQSRVGGSLLMGIRKTWPLSNFSPEQAAIRLKKIPARRALYCREQWLRNNFIMVKKE